MLTVLDLFSGIGGFSLGLERTGGFRTIAFCEIEPYCQAVLRKHWPDVPIFPDVTKLGAADVGQADVICGGFPCQDLSVAGKQAGIDGERSGLWKEFARLIGEVRPLYVIVENVPGLLSNGMGRVLGDLAALRYDAEWHCIPAAAIGAPHRRDRIWIVAQPQCDRRQSNNGRRIVPNQDRQHSSSLWQPQQPQGSVYASSLADADKPRLAQPTWGQFTSLPAAHEGEERREFGGGTSKARYAWATEPDVGRVVDGIPSRVDRLRSLGNAVVPQVVQVIGQAILEAYHD